MRQPFNPRATWLMKPILGTRVDPSHDLAPSAGVLLNEGGGSAPVALYGVGTAPFSGSAAWVTGSQGPAISIPAASSFLTLPNLSAFRPLLPATIRTRILVTSLAAARSIVYTDGWIGLYAGIFLKVETSGFVSASTGDNGGNGGLSRRTTTATSNALSVNTWYDVVASLVTTTNMSLYVNGKLCTSSTSGSGGALAYSGTPGIIGHEATSNNLTLSGSIDHLLIWPRALTAAEVALLYVNPWCFMQPPVVPRFWLVPTGGAAPYAHRTLGNRAGSRTLRPASGEL